MTAAGEPSPTPAASWFLYVVRTRHGTLYTGVTTDVQRRLAEHAGGAPRGAKYLRSRGPLTLAYSVELGDRSLALRAEVALKRLERDAKERLIREQATAEVLVGMLGLTAAGSAPDGR